MISVVDYGAGNIGSVTNMIKKVGGEVEIISDPHSLEQVEKLLLPGVGAFDHGMRSLIECPQGEFRNISRALIEAETVRDHECLDS